MASWASMDNEGRGRLSTGRSAVPERAWLAGVAVDGVRVRTEVPVLTTFRYHGRTWFGTRAYAGGLYYVADLETGGTITPGLADIDLALHWARCVLRRKTRAAVEAAIARRLASAPATPNQARGPRSKP